MCTTLRKYNDPKIDYAHKIGPSTHWSSYSEAFLLHKNSGLISCNVEASLRDA